MPNLLVESLLPFLLLILFVLTVVVQLSFHWYIFSKLALYKTARQRTSNQGVSVVICGKNESANLKRNLPVILEQDYPNYEVVVVNDASSDDSELILEYLSKKYDHLKIIHLRQDLNFFRGKKFPLSIGIKSAKNDIILLTDADCTPAGKNWIRTMEKNFKKSKDIVLGYGAYEKSGGLLNRLIRYDTMNIAMQYFSFALNGLAYMGVGRNLSYRKSLFYSTKGFVTHYKVSSGDDDLFINQVANKENTSIEIQPGSFTISKPANSFGKWFRQKRRHLSTGKYYKAPYKLLLGMYSGSQIAFYTLLVFVILFPFNWIIAASVFAFRFISQIIILKKCSYKLNEKDLLVFSPVLEVLLILINLLLFITNLVFRQNKWK